MFLTRRMSPHSVNPDLVGFNPVHHANPNDPHPTEPQPLPLRGP